MYTIVKLTDNSPAGKEYKKIPVRVVVTPYFLPKELVDIIDLKTMVKTTKVKLKKTGGTISLVSSMFTTHVNKYVVLQELKMEEYVEILSFCSERLYYHPQEHKISPKYTIASNNNKIIMHVISDEFIEGLKKIV